MPRAVLDTNILVSALITPRGTPANIIHAWRAEQFDLVTSPLIVEELQEALSRPKIRRRYHLSTSDIQNFLTLLTQATILAAGTRSVSAPIHDPDDLRILATAVESHADYPRHRGYGLAQTETVSIRPDRLTRSVSENNRAMK